MLRNQLNCFAIFIKQTIITTNINKTSYKRLLTTLTPEKITELLRRNEINLNKNILPSYIKSVECNQLASNSPIEDRLRISYLNLPNSKEPTLILGVFDGHGGGTTADIISRRLFNYIAVSLYPKTSDKFQISNNNEHFKKLLVDVYNSPPPKHDPIQLQPIELELLSNFRDQLLDSANITDNLRASFIQCDDDLSKEIQDNLMKKSWSDQTQSVLHYYLSAAVSGCCALVMVIHEGIGYLASTGDCRGVLGLHEQSVDEKFSDKQTDKPITSQSKNKQSQTLVKKFQAIELNDEHNCDNINEIRRLASSHPVSEQNTMIKHNRLLGHLMPFRAFGDFSYKWSKDIINACGITRAFGSGVIPSNYKTPPYLISEPDINQIQIVEKDNNFNVERYVVIASDGLWELFESSRDVIETIVDHSLNVNKPKDDYYDENSATHTLRAALRSGSQQDFGLDSEELKRLYHIRLESTLTLPQSVVRNFRDDISIVVMKLQ